MGCKSTGEQWWSLCSWQKGSILKYSFQYLMSSLKTEMINLGICFIDLVFLRAISRMLDFQVKLPSFQGWVNLYTSICTNYKPLSVYLVTISIKISRVWLSLISSVCEKSSNYPSFIPYSKSGVNHLSLHSEFITQFIFKWALSCSKLYDICWSTENYSTS